MRDHLVGKRFHHLTVKNIIINKEQQSGRCNVICDCGTEKIVWIPNLYNGKTQSCGCATVHKEPKVKEPTTPEYRIWSGLQYRSVKDGVQLCERWQSFETFMLDMGSRPDDSYRFRRIHLDQGFSPDNCKWAKEIYENKRTRSITFNNKTQSLSAWARELGMSRATLWGRVNTMPLEIAMSYKVDELPTKQVIRKARADEGYVIARRQKRIKVKE